jgi:predicted nuclease of predicted toxin-antitoxin system
MKFLLDEGVPVSVGSVLKGAGHDVIFFNNSGLAKGTPDPVVCAAAESHDAVLVAADHDMKRLAKGHGITKARFKSMGLVRFECRKPDCSTRIDAALSLVEHEWEKVTGGHCARLFVVIGEATIRTHR